MTNADEWSGLFARRAQRVQSLIDRRLATILSMTHCPSDRKIDPKDVTTVGGRQEVWQIWPWGEAMIFRT